MREVSWLKSTQPAARTGNDKESPKAMKTAIGAAGVFFCVAGVLTSFADNELWPIWTCLGLLFTTVSLTS